jgi:hypothetical protein
MLSPRARVALAAIAILAVAGGAYYWYVTRPIPLTDRQRDIARRVAEQPFILVEGDAVATFYRIGENGSLIYRTREGREYAR